jgi:DNA polymerase-3 subunit gamma/tau
MGYQVLARKYRPQTFDEVIAQEHITETLKNAIITGHLAQAFLFTGPRGIGKTSMARILAKALNCEKSPTITPCNQCKNCREITNSTSPDVIEIDGASHTSVEDVRDLQNELLYPPQYSPYKIYIIDEVHMLSKNAFNALLKTLEEPPANVKFIFATTEPHKVLPTIISRCQRYDFHRIPIHSIIEGIKNITAHENVSIENQSAFLIAKKAEGSMRDALSLTDQLLSFGKETISKEDVKKIFGIIDIDFYKKLLQSIIEHSTKDIIEAFHGIVEEGSDITELTDGLIENFRNVLLIKLKIQPEEVYADDIPTFKEFGKNFSDESLLYAISMLIDTREKIKTASQPELLLEATLLKLAYLEQLIPVETLEKKVFPPKQSPSDTLLPPTSMRDKKKEIHTESVAPPTKNEQPTEDIDKETSVPKKQVKITEEILEQELPKIMEKVREDMPICAVHLSKAKLESIKNNFLHYTTNSKVAYKSLSDSSQSLAQLLTAHFSTTVKISFKYTPQSKDKYIDNPTINDIKKESPKLAKFIEAIDGFIIGQQKPVDNIP